MASPIIDNLVLPDGRILVLPDEESETTGNITLRSSMGGGRFIVSSGGVGGVEVEYSHILFTKEGCAEVKIDNVDYLVMHQANVVGLIPD